MKKTLLFVGFLLFSVITFGAQVVTYQFAEKDSALFMDVYMPSQEITGKRPCVLYVFGGGFVTGSRLDSSVVAFCDTLAERGFVVAAIDYRLGMKGKKMKGLFSAAKNVEHAINLAVEDLFSAISFLIAHSDVLTIDPQKIILMGSSAGAITVLQSDYELGNRTEVTKVVPDSFRFAGVVSFAGAVFSRHGLVKYKTHAPAPTLMFHGTADKLVTYNKIQFANLGFFGTNALGKRFAKFGYPHYIYRYEELGHEVAILPHNLNVNDICWFIENMVFQQKFYQIDMLHKDTTLINNRPSYSGIDPFTFYKE